MIISIEAKDKVLLKTNPYIMRIFENIHLHLYY